MENPRATNEATKPMAQERSRQSKPKKFWQMMMVKEIVQGNRKLEDSLKELTESPTVSSRPGQRAQRPAGRPDPQ